jgi:hypothetical protein
VFSPQEIEAFLAQPVAIEEKIDGANIGFSLDSAHYYQYDSPGGVATGFTARAVGNLDGDAVNSTFLRTGLLSNGEVQGSQIQISNELE